ncbi:hypothetical protein C8Q77DRAFT_1116415 [Trametes polyzona]|nr:hypothetical protein C8Q77DRAFT_1116415 [Trametes polyzona]
MACPLLWRHVLISVHCITEPHFSDAVRRLRHGTSGGTGGLGEIMGYTLSVCFINVIRPIYNIRAAKCKQE